MKKNTRREEILTKRLEKRLVLIVAGLLVFAIVLFFFGVPLLINFSLFVNNLRGGNDAGTPANESIYIAPPVLDSLPAATNSARLTVSGSSFPNYHVKLYLNGRSIKDLETDKEGNFVFKSVALKQGTNDIKAKAVDSNNKSSEFTSVHRIVYKNKSPELKVNFPADQQTLTGNSQIKIEGKTDTNTQVTVNDYWAIVDDEGIFSYLLNLQQGENKIKITATDEAGNQTTSEIRVTFNP